MESSEGIPIEYIAIFVAVLFPGALVAFDSELLQTLPSLTVLRVYTAGIWHNAVVSFHICVCILYFSSFRPVNKLDSLLYFY